jgi:hypothetical protein
VFDEADRARVRALVLEMAEADPRIVAGAELGSLVDGRADRWSDLDLTFAVAPPTPVIDVLDDWSERLAERLDAVRLFDLPVGSTVYRVFLLPGALQVDISITPAAEFWPRGPAFRLAFGAAGETRLTPPPLPGELFGLGVEDVRTARVAIERERYWQALYFIESLRNHGLAIACVRRGLKASYGRGFHDLPESVLEAAGRTLVSTLDRPHLIGGLRAGVDLLLAESVELGTIVHQVRPQLLELSAPGDL